MVGPCVSRWTPRFPAGKHGAGRPVNTSISPADRRLSAGKHCALWLLCVSLLAIGGCERRVAEPDGSAPVTTVAIAAEARPKPDPLAGRCIKRTGDSPQRMAPALGPDPRCPADRSGRPELPWGRVAFTDAKVEVKVERVADDSQRQRGLMYRTSLPEDEGMLFIFAERRVHRFWMKNTCISLDMLFIDHDGLIVGIEENVPTMNERTYQVGCPSQYVLEVNAGWARRHGVRAGQWVTFEGVSGSD